MRFTAEREDLLSAVKRASGVVQSRNVIPVLGCLHIAATDTGVKVRGTSQDEWVTVSVTASVSQPGETCINAALLSAWLAATTKGGLASLTLADDRANLVVGRATASFATLNPMAFPVPPERDAKTEIPNAIDAVRTCAPYASTDEASFNLLGVAICGGHAVATNRHLLCAVDISAPDDVAVIIPSAGVRQIGMCSDGARLFVGLNTWACEDENILVGGKLIDGQFPDWKRAIPMGQRVVATVDADAMAEAVTQVQIASGERAKVIVLEGDGSSIAIACRGELMQAGSSVSCEGETFRTGINCKYAQTAMTTFAGRVISLASEGPETPIVIRSDAVPGLFAAVFPLRV
jgi:DNA polymerase-3 subunit beta